MQLVRHCIAVILLLLVAAAGSAQTPAPQPVEGESELLVFATCLVKQKLLLLQLFLSMKSTPLVVSAAEGLWAVTMNASRR